MASKNCWSPMRGCLAPAVLEMAFLQSEHQAKAMWQPGAGDHPVAHPAAAHGAHCFASHTASVDRSSQPAASQHPQLPYVLAQGSQQSPSSSDGGPLGISPSLPSQGAAPGDQTAAHSSAATSLGGGTGESLQALYSYCCFHFCWMIWFLSLLSFPSFINILIVLSSLLWQACASFQTPGKAFY